VKTKLSVPAKEKKQEWPFIKKRQYPSGVIGWIVDARTRDGGSRKTFETKAEAETFACQQRTTRVNQGNAGIAISEKLRIQAIEADKRLKEVGSEIPEAVEYFLRHAKPSAGPKAVKDVATEFIASKKNANRRPLYLSIQGYVLGKFSKQFGERNVHEVSGDEIKSWMDRQTWKLRTRKNYQQDLRNFFGFAVGKKYLATNPLKDFEKITLDDHPPGILTVPQAVALLNAAEVDGEGESLPYVAIGLFAGLRSSELKSLDWKEVSISERTIEVTAAKAKTRARRIVEITENLAAWLKPYERHEEPVTPNGIRFRLERIIKAAKIERWPKNALRHSFGSYHLAFHKNAPRTSLEMGHDNPDQLFQSYRELVKPKDAIRYWQIKPGKKGEKKIVQFVA
jgi:integrase